MRSVICLLACVVSALCLTAQTNDREELRADLDYARFDAQNDWSYVEIYFSFAREQFAYVPESGTYTAQFQVTLEFFENDSSVSDLEWRNVDRIDSLGAVKGQRLYDQCSVFLRPGMYLMKVRIDDLHNGRHGTLEKKLVVDAVKKDQMRLSDLQLGLNISPSDAESKFVKNGLWILPNPYALYSEDWPVLYYYCELYNLSPLQEGVDSTYQVTVTIKDTAAKTIRIQGPKTKKRAGKSLVEAGSLVVSNLMSDSYTIEIQVIDAARADTVVESKQFYVFRTADFAGVPEPDSIDKKIMDTRPAIAELDLVFEKLRYIASKEEIELFRSLDTPEAKIAFLTRFWQMRDPDPTDRGNPYKDEYMDRLAKVEYNFSSGEKQGWQTDQGRVFLIYGPPDQIDRFPSNLGHKPYQIWYYNSIDSGVEFIFVDQGGYNDMILVHSTHRNEIKDYRWMEKWFRD
ncbi:GWxTD domain-containing protein [bacterium]|nr:GWxTD domain-containing protein [bacterium]